MAGYDSWTFHDAQGEPWGVRVSWYVGNEEGDVYVSITSPLGVNREARGRARITRTLRVGPGERLTEPISYVEVTSLLGDIAVNDSRSFKRAAQAYASAVLDEFVKQAEHERRAEALTPVGPVGRSFYVTVDGPSKNIAIEQAEALARFTGFDFGPVLHAEEVDTIDRFHVFEVVLLDVAETARVTS